MQEYQMKKRPVVEDTTPVKRPKIYFFDIKYIRKGLLSLEMDEQFAIYAYDYSDALLELKKELDPIAKRIDRMRLSLIDYPIDKQ